MLDFDGIMQVAQELDLPSPPDVDRLTDEIASGAKTEAELAEEWGAAYWGRQNADTGGEGTGREESALNRCSQCRAASMIQRMPKRSCREVWWAESRRTCGSEYRT